MIIREATVTDSSELSEIYKYYVDHSSYSFEYLAPSAEEFSKRMIRILERFPYFVCVEGEEILGFAYAHEFKERKAYQWVCETSIYTKKSCTQKGIGTMLYAELIPALKRQGYVKAIAVLGCPNEGSEIFHQKMGFSLAATLPDIGYKQDSWHDTKYYVLDLNELSNDMPDPIEYTKVKT